MSQNQNEKSRKKAPDQYLRYSSLALQLMITIGLFFAAGYYIDGFFNLEFPVFTLVLSFLALGGIFYKLFQELKRNS